jgi:hypothetical protein
VSFIGLISPVQVVPAQQPLAAYVLFTFVCFAFLRYSGAKTPLIAAKDSRAPGSDENNLLRRIFACTLEERCVFCPSGIQNAHGKRRLARTPLSLKIRRYGD